MKGVNHCKLECTTVAHTHTEANGIHKNVLPVVPRRICTRSDHMRAQLVSGHEYHSLINKACLYNNAVP